MAVTKGQKLLKQLAAAQEASDTDQIDAIMKQLADIVAKPIRQGVKKAPGKPAKAPKPAKVAAEASEPQQPRKSSPRTSRSKSKPVVQDDGVSLETQVVPSSWMAPTMSPGDARERREGRRVSMAGMKHVNTFKDNGKGGISGNLKQYEKQLAQQKPTARPGQGGSSRTPTKKVKVRCEGCSGEFEVYPSEVLRTFDENERTYAYFKCDRCIRRGK